MGALEADLVLPLASTAASAHQHWTKVYTTVIPVYLIQPPVLLWAQVRVLAPLTDTQPKAALLSEEQPSCLKASHSSLLKGKPRILLDYEAGSLLAPL